MKYFVLKFMIFGNGGIHSYNHSNTLLINLQPVSDCGPLSDPGNGVVDTSNGTTFGEVATFFCDTGYSLIGDDQRDCQSDGLWGGTSPTCEIKGMSRLCREVIVYLVCTINDWLHEIDTDVICIL